MDGQRVRTRGISLLLQLPVFLPVWLIRIYQLFISPLKPPTCRFYPTCSQYALDALCRFGLLKGGFLAVKRIVKCHPMHPGGHDPL